MQTLILLALIPTLTLAADKFEIKSGAQGSSYCTPFDSPKCQAYNQRESQNLYERKQYERRVEDLERRERERERDMRNLDRDYSRNSPR